MGHRGARRASKEPIDKGGWNIFYTYLGGFGNISPAPNIAIREQRHQWQLVRLADRSRRWRNCAPPGSMRRTSRRSRRSASEMQAEFWQNPPYAPLGMYDQPTAFHTYLQDVRDGWPQFYGVRRA